MAGSAELQQLPQSDELYMLAGWRQWADAGSISSALPRYLVRRLKASKIGHLPPDGHYLFQIPGTHDLVRPVVKLRDGFPESLNAPRNDFYYAGDARRGVVIFSGDEPHMDVERYTTDFLDAARRLNVRRIIAFGGVYGELPYDKERMVSAIYSMPALRDELNQYAVNLSNYHGGASIGTYICRRAADVGIEFVGFYAFVPMYDVSNVIPDGQMVRIENDYTAWLGVMRRVNHMFGLDIDLTDLSQQSERLMTVLDRKVDELEQSAPQLGVRAYMERLATEFTEQPFLPLDDVWEEEIRHLFDDDDGDYDDEDDA